ncbi:unannotated protein [freshwater metagenome]|uniref:Unannotated protein n=1 Tax=freshwater metagenome TaxID=449393 RepID=A0A6J6TFA9_9ZZZZ
MSSGTGAAKKIGSLKRAARRAAGFDVPPSMNGGVGLLTGMGVTCTVVPRYSKGSPVQALSMVSMHSSMSLPRSAQSLP